MLGTFRSEIRLVGPRPEVTKYVEMFYQDYETILSIRPGITDPASIAFHDESSLLAETADPERAYLTFILPQKITLARQYVEQRSLGMYFYLLGRTLGTLCFRSRPRAE